MTPESVSIKTVIQSSAGRLRLQTFIVTSKAQKPLSEVQQHLEAHMHYIAKLELSGQLLMAGPLCNEDGATWNGDGQLVYVVSDIAEALALAQADPLHISGSRIYAIRPWIVNVGSMQLSLRFSTRTLNITGSI
jgi:uncharacterized protein YciI